MLVEELFELSRVLSAKCVWDDQKTLQVEFKLLLRCHAGTELSAPHCGDARTESHAARRVAREARACARTRMQACWDATRAGGTPRVHQFLGHARTTKQVNFLVEKWV